MYQDSPDWQVLFNLLRAIYHKNPVRIDIAGTVESISQITAELLYSCYNTFYNLSNMALSVVGNVKKDDVLSIADKILKKEEVVEFQQIIPEESDDIKESYVEEALGVDIPKFAIGFKHKSKAAYSVKEIITMNIALDIIGGKVSSLYQELMEKELINTSFGKEFFCGRGFASSIFTGEGKESEKVRDALIERIEAIKKNGISDEDFAVSLKRLYGAEIFGFNEVDDLASNLIDCYFNGYGLFDAVECYKTVTKSDVEKIIKDNFSADKCALSVIK